MVDKISSFKAEYSFLSNFYPAMVKLGDEVYPTVEHAYQAAKTTDVAYRLRTKLSPTPAGARAFGRSPMVKAKMRPDWEDVKVGIMLELLIQKFSDSVLAEKLLATGDAILVEGNNWGDTFWGQVNGKGENMLGVLLGIVRGIVRRKLYLE